MFSKFLLKKIGIFVLISFVFLIGTSEYSFADEEDVLLKARKYYQDGNYDKSVKVLQKFIENLQAIVEQKKNVAEAFYLLAKVYYTVGEDAEVDKNLKKVYETFPSFSKEENDMEFKKKVDKIRKDMGMKKIVSPVPVKKVEKQKTDKKVITKEGKKKKKFPVLLVVGGVVIIAVLALLLLKKKEEVYDIRGEWIVTHRVVIYGENIVDEVVYNFDGNINNGSFEDHYEDRGNYIVDGKNVELHYTTVDWHFFGNFDTNDTMSGNFDISNTTDTFSGSWTARRIGTSNNVKKSLKTSNSILKKFYNK